MPYIKANDGRREALRKGEPALTAGELNYQIFYYVKHNYENNTIYAKDYLRISTFVNNFLGEKPNYQKYNDMTGALIRCYKEIERRLPVSVESDFICMMNSYDEKINKYEDEKINENGDVE